MRPLIIVFGLVVLLGMACSSDTGPASTPKQSTDLIPIRVPIAPVLDHSGGNEPANPVDESTYDVDCMVPILGRSLTDDIVYGDRGATAEELAKIVHCKLRLDYSKKSPDGQNSGDAQGAGGDQDKCDSQGNCDDDEKDSYDSSGYTYTCHGFDVDHHGMPTGPQCNLVPPPLPDGVTQGMPLSVSLPDTSHQSQLKVARYLIKVNVLN